MTEQRNNSGGFTTNTINTIIGIVGMVIALVLMFYIARFIYRILWFLSPVMLIAALIIDRKSVFGFGKWMVGLFRQNTVVGVVSIVLTAIAFPLVSAFLLGKAFLSKKVTEIKMERTQRDQNEFVDFEELDSKPLELPELDRQEEKRKKDNYDDLFE